MHTVELDPAEFFYKIQDAINAASGGETILVYEGTYVENVNVLKVELINGTFGIASWGTDNSVISKNIIHDDLNARRT